jgi:hypothetical protein|nr:MAG TPA: hypothetical protein [Caudoviricetes sp.]
MEVSGKLPLAIRTQGFYGNKTIMPATKGCGKPEVIKFGG